ncbi:MAG: helix-turn-helix domain-containing protein [Deltaproteobacteria bacterium]|nr:helix-turn-helix domain-containing protein [Deltaproteobacteria bacterium]
MSREQLARLAGVSTETVRSIEKGKIIVPGLFVAADIVYALNGRLDKWLRNSASTGRTRSLR